MPNIPQQQTIVQYITNVSQLTYTFAFYAPLPIDIQVFYQASNATPVPSSDILTLNVDYSVTYNADPTTGGTITLLFTPMTGYYLTINRQVQASLNTEFSLAQNFNGGNLDAALDRLLLLCQQNQNYALQRNLSYVINTYLPPININLPNPSTQLPTLPPNYVWMGSGSGVIAALISTVPSASTLQSQLANNSPGTDGARLVGYYDIVNNTATTVDAFLQNLPTFITNLVNNYGVDTGITNALVANNVIGANTLYPGLVVTVKVLNTNSGNSTLNWNGLGAVTIDFNGANVIGGMLVANLTYEFLYTGSTWAVIQPTITFATNTQALSGTDSTHPLTSAGIASSQSAATNGYITFPGGLTFQWGTTGTIAPNGNTTVTFPVAFTTAGLNAQATVMNTTSGANSAAAISNLGTANMIVYNTTQSGPGNALTWFAIGK